MKTAHDAFFHSLETWRGHSGGEGLVARDVHDPRGVIRPRSVWLSTPPVPPDRVQNVIVATDGRNALDLHGSLHGGVQANLAAGARTAVLAVDHGDVDRIAEYGDFSPGGLGWYHARFVEDVVESLLTRFPAMHGAMFASLGSSMGGGMAMHQLLNGSRYAVGISLSGAFQHSNGFNSNAARRDHLSSLDARGPAGRVGYLDAGAVGEPEVVLSNGQMLEHLECRGFSAASIFEPASPLHNLYAGVYAYGLGTEHREDHWAERVRRMFAPDGVFGPDFGNLRAVGHLRRAP